MIGAILLGLVYAIIATALIEGTIRIFNAIDLGILLLRLGLCLLSAVAFAFGSWFAFELGLRWRLVLATAFLCFLYTFSHVVSETILKGWSRYTAQRTRGRGISLS